MSHTVIDEFGNENTYDDHGNIIHYKNSDGHEAWAEYDDNGNQTHYKNSYGFEEWSEYDDHGNCIHIKNSDGLDVWYDSDGNEISKEEYEKLLKRNSVMSHTEIKIKNEDALRMLQFVSNVLVYLQGKETRNTITDSEIILLMECRSIQEKISSYNSF